MPLTQLLFTSLCLFVQNGGEHRFISLSYWKEEGKNSHNSVQVQDVRPRSSWEERTFTRSHQPPPGSRSPGGGVAGPSWGRLGHSLGCTIQGLVANGGAPALGREIPCSSAPCTEWMRGWEWPWLWQEREQE